MRLPMINIHLQTGAATILIASLSLCSVSIVVSQQAAETLATLNIAFIATNFVPGLDDQIIEPLMIAFLVVMVEISVHSAT